MSMLSSLKSVGNALGIWQSTVEPVGCTLGRAVYRETKWATRLVNFSRPRHQLNPATQAMLRVLFPSLNVARIRYRTGCRLPPNRFRERGSIYAMTFGYSIYWRGALDESNPSDVVNLIHEVMHVEQVRRLGGEARFACEYGKGYLEGGGALPSYISNPGAYHRNPLEAEAYTFEGQFQDDQGQVLPDRIPWD